MKKRVFAIKQVNIMFIEYSLFVFIIAIFMILVRDILKIWTSYATLEMYSYLTITPVVIGILYVSVLKRISINTSLLKYLYVLLIFSFGLLLLYVSIGLDLTREIVETYNDQLMMLGIILLLHSLVIHFGKEDSLLKIFLLTLAQLILVPPPPSWMFRFSIILTEALLATTIPISRLIGLNISVREDYLYRTVSIDTDGQTIDFNIAPICSGIIGLTSVIALSPLLLLIGLKGRCGLRKKILAGFISILVFTALMYLVNVLRMVMIFYFSTKYGVEVGYRIFHQTPEIILAIPVTFLVIKIIDYINGGFSLNLSIRRFSLLNGGYVSDISLEKMVAIATPLILLILVTIPLGNLALASTNPLNFIYSRIHEGPIKLINVKDGSAEDYVPSLYGNIHIRYFGRVKEFEEAAGETTRVHYYRGFYGVYKTLDVYVEFADKPGDIHVWELCLPVNEINITYWNILDIKDPVENIVFSVREIHYSWGRINGVLIYWKDRVYTDVGLRYYRTTVMVNSYGTPIDEYDKKIVYELAERLVLRNLQASFVKHARSTVGFNYYVNIYVPIVVTLVVSYSFLYLKKHHNVLKIRLMKLFGREST